MVFPLGASHEHGLVKPRDDEPVSQGIYARNLKKDTESGVKKRVDTPVSLATAAVAAVARSAPPGPSIPPRLQGRVACSRFLETLLFSPRVNEAREVVDVLHHDMILVYFHAALGGKMI
jgi:hypothetical protein